MAVNPYRDLDDDENPIDPRYNENLGAKRWEVDTIRIDDGGETSRLRIEREMTIHFDAGYELVSHVGFYGSGSCHYITFRRLRT
jgi:hypothetical protein